MVITDHFVDVNDNAWFTVSTPEYDISENILSEQLLSIDPTQIELYQYLNTTTKPTTPCYDIQDNIQSLIMDYFEVACYTGALELVETTLIAHLKPSTIILQAMISLLLRKREASEGRQYKEDWLLTDQTHALLQKIITLFGHGVFDYVWDTFDQGHIKKQQQQLGGGGQQHSTYEGGGDGDTDSGDEDLADALMLMDGLGAFDDFWAFVAQCFVPDSPLVQAKSYLYVLDILITLLEQDFQSKRDCSANVKKATLLKTLRKNVVGGWDRFEHYLTILLGPFAHDAPVIIHIKQKQAAGRLFNLMIAMSRYDISLSMPDLADQTFRSATQLDVLPALVQYIQFDAFILQVCDAGFINANWSEVPQHYHYLKKSKLLPTAVSSSSVVENTSQWLEKWLHAYTKLRPPSPSTQWSTLYLHVWMIKQYYHRILNISALRYHTNTETTPAPSLAVVVRGCHDLDQDALAALLEDHLVKIKWEKQVRTWMDQCRQSRSASEEGEEQEQWERRIGWLLDTFIF